MEAEVRIVDYEPKFHHAFKTLNEEWITKYFVMEDSDYKALEHPQEYILDKGGRILVALYNDEPVGVCALIKVDDSEYDYELAKMAVSPKAQGKKIGWMLGNAIIRLAKDMGATKIFLESNSKLEAALSLYEKLGFKYIHGRPTPYARADIQMELDLIK